MYGFCRLRIQQVNVRRDCISRAFHVYILYCLTWKLSSFELAGVSGFSLLLMAGYKPTARIAPTKRPSAGSISQIGTPVAIFKAVTMPLPDNRSLNSTACKENMFRIGSSYRDFVISITYPNLCCGGEGLIVFADWVAINFVQGRLTLGLGSTRYHNRRMTHLSVSIKMQWTKFFGVSLSSFRPKWCICVGVAQDTGKRMLFKL